MLRVELTPDEVELLTQAFRASLQPNPQDRGFTVSSYGQPVDSNADATDVAGEEAARWGRAVRGLVDKGLFESVNDLSGAFRLSRGGVQRAAEMNPPSVPS